MAADKTIGRSEALRRSMVALIEQARRMRRSAYRGHLLSWSGKVASGTAPSPLATRPSFRNLPRRRPHLPHGLP
jgi:hypothetical protein